MIKIDKLQEPQADTLFERESHARQGKMQDAEAEFMDRVLKDEEHVSGTLMDIFDQISQDLEADDKTPLDCVSRQTFTSCMQNQAIITRLAALDVEIFDAENMHTLMDFTTDGFLKLDAFVLGVKALRGTGRARRQIAQLQDIQRLDDMVDGSFQSLVCKRRRSLGRHEYVGLSVARPVFRRWQWEVMEKKSTSGGMKVGMANLAWPLSKKVWS